MFSVAPDGLRLLIASTSVEKPNTSDNRDEHLAVAVAHLAGPGQEADCGSPFLPGQLDVFCKVVQVPDERGHHLAGVCVFTTRALTLATEPTSVK